MAEHPGRAGVGPGRVLLAPPRTDPRGPTVLHAPAARHGDQPRLRPSGAGPRGWDGAGLLWVRGGNSFVLHKAAASGFDRAVPELLRRDALVDGGYSAGVCLLAPTLAGIDLCDDPHETPAGYEELPHETRGLGVVPFAGAPHLRSPEHPESAVVEEVVEWFLEHRIPFVALRDGDVILRDGTDVRVLPCRDQ